MSMFKFANVLLETNPRSLSYPSLYCAADSPVVYDEPSGEWLMVNRGTYDFSTYFNGLSVAKLLKYTTAKRFFLHLELKGAACKVYQTYGGSFDAHPQTIKEPKAELAASDDWQSVDFELGVDANMVLTGFKIESEGRLAIRKSYYSFELAQEPRDIELVVATTTFKKEAFIERNIGLVRNQIIESGEEIADHFHMYVMDNGRTLDAKALSSERITVRPNDNVGGAGGFTRGMIEAMEQQPVASHILLMDDDVAVSPESIKRTYNLLRILKDEYREAFISGAMLNYEIGEDQWEDVGYMTPQGTFAPAKPMLRMTQYTDLIYNEEFKPTGVQKEQMYAAWWYCCIPISAIKRNGLPLPVFVRCDDAEYGIRCHPTFITMNSLCVWHMSFHERYNAAVERYQTTRNTMIAQATTGMAPKSDFLKELHNNIRLELKKFGYENAELCLDAFEDFLKGPGFISKPVAEGCFMQANRNKEQLVDFDELQRRADADPELKGFNLHDIDRQLIDGDKPRSLAQRLEDLATDNGQRYLKKPGSGYAVIPLVGWAYPAGAIHGKKKLVVIDWYNRKGAIRTKDVKRYAQIKARYAKDLRYYKANIERLRKEYAAARPTLTSVAYWKHYLKMD